MGKLLFSVCICVHFSDGLLKARFEYNCGVILNFVCPKIYFKKCVVVFSGTIQTRI